MIRGIAIVGLNGSGKSTLAHALAKKLNFYEIDVEDYYFPAQKDARRKALDNLEDASAKEGAEKIPYSDSKTKNEVQSKMLEDIYSNPDFILSSVTMEWNEETLSHIDIAFWIQTPFEERMRRIQTREEKRFGNRVLSGGDMYEQQKSFRQLIAGRQISIVEESIKKLHCPVYVLDGMQPVEEIVTEALQRVEPERGVSMSGLI